MPAELYLVTTSCSTYSHPRSYPTPPYVYKNGGEPGIAVGLINYPRFPSTPGAIKAHAMAIAGMLMECCRQLKVTVVMPTETVMIGEPELG